MCMMSGEKYRSFVELRVAGKPPLRLFPEQGHYDFQPSLRLESGLENQ